MLASGKITRGRTTVVTARIAAVLMIASTKMTTTATLQIADTMDALPSSRGGGTDLLILCLRSEAARPLPGLYGVRDLEGPEDAVSGSPGPYQAPQKPLGLGASPPHNETSEAPGRPRRSLPPPSSVLGFFLFKVLGFRV